MEENGNELVMRIVKIRYKNDECILKLTNKKKVSELTKTIQNRWKLTQDITFCHKDTSSVFVRLTSINMVERFLRMDLDEYMLFVFLDKDIIEHDGSRYTFKDYFSTPSSILQQEPVASQLRAKPEPAEFRVKPESMELGFQPESMAQRAKRGNTGQSAKPPGIEPRVKQERIEPRVKQERIEPRVKQEQIESRVRHEQIESRARQEQIESKIKQERTEPKISSMGFEPRVNSPNHEQRAGQESLIPQDFHHREVRVKRELSEPPLSSHRPNIKPNTSPPSTYASSTRSSSGSPQSKFINKGFTNRTVETEPDKLEAATLRRNTPAILQLKPKLDESRSVTVPKLEYELNTTSSETSLIPINHNLELANLVYSRETGTQSPTQPQTPPFEAKNKVFIKREPTDSIPPVIPEHMSPRLLPAKPEPTSPNPASSSSQLSLAKAIQDCCHDFQGSLATFPSARLILEALIDQLVVGVPLNLDALQHTLQRQLITQYPPPPPPDFSPLPLVPRSTTWDLTCSDDHSPSHQYEEMSD